MQKVNIKDKIGKISGIYKLTFPNGKIYIGQSIDIKRRIREHNSSSKGVIIPHVIAKYGKISDFEILEIIPADQQQLMNEREAYYIQFYHSLTTENGYNILMNSDSKRDINLPWVQEIISLLKDDNFTEQEIANIMGKSVSVITSINTGKTYFNSQLKYPIRQKKVSHNQILSEQQAFGIIDLLKTNVKMTMLEIANIYNVSEITVRRINRGDTPYHYNNLNYPIRKKNQNFCKFSQQEIEEIINLLKNSNKTQIEIAKMYNCDRKLIGQINSGKKYLQENIVYPIRD